MTNKEDAKRTALRAPDRARAVRRIVEVRDHRVAVASVGAVAHFIERLRENHEARAATIKEMNP